MITTAWVGMVLRSISFILFVDSQFLETRYPRSCDCGFEPRPGTDFIAQDRLSGID